MMEILLVFLFFFGVISAVFGIACLFERTRCFRKIFRWLMRQIMF